MGQTMVSSLNGFQTTAEMSDSAMLAYWSFNLMMKELCVFNYETLFMLWSQVFDQAFQVLGLSLIS